MSKIIWGSIVTLGLSFLVGHSLGWDYIQSVKFFVGAAATAVTAFHVWVVYFLGYLSQKDMEMVCTISIEEMPEEALKPWHVWMLVVGQLLATAVVAWASDSLLLTATYVVPAGAFVLATMAMESGSGCSERS